MWRSFFPRFFLALALGSVASIAAADTVVRLRVMLHPQAAADAPQGDTIARLQALAGVPLSLAGTTRTGGLELSLAEPQDERSAQALVARLRDDRTVLWAEAVHPAPVLASRSRTAAQGQKLMLRLTAQTAPDWPTLLPRWSSLIGMPLTLDRSIGSIWVLKLDRPVADAELGNMASQLETDSAVQYADPVRRAVAKLIPNDPSFPSQWALSDPIGGINAATAWDLQTGSTGVTVAVIDTGITSHPDLAGRVLPGFDFITHTADASDPGDATDDGECGPDFPGQPSSWHGTFVSGLIAANTNNGVGIAGIDWNAKILPVRVLGQCGGTFDAIAEGILWAAGLPVFDAPPNPHPAKVINMSLGGFTACPQAVQDAVNQALAQGVVITAAAGNESDDASSSAPADCSGVISVGAATRAGDRTFYSNFGRGVTISAPGGDGGDASTLILSTTNDGLTTPKNPIYKAEAGTSFASPQVAGVASLMFARNANLRPFQVQSIMTGTARKFAPGSVCAFAGGCGAGLLDAGLALQSTALATSVAPAGTVPVVEYYRAEKDHYFMTADPAEIAHIDAFLPAFQRTGEVFFAWVDPSLAPANAQPVCRFFSPLPLIDSHFYTAIASECQFVQARWPGVWLLEQVAAFYVPLPDAAGRCQPGTLPVYRFFDNRVDANHRHTIDLTARNAMINRGWVPEGIGPNSVAFCSPI